MSDPFVWFWSGMFFASIAWYAFLLFWLGVKGGYEIFHMIKVLSRPDAGETPP